MPPLKVGRGAGVTALALALLVLTGTLVWALHDSAPPPARQSGQQSGQESGQQSGPAPAVLRSRLPLYPLLHTPTATSRRVHEAQQRLIARCMAERGFRYEAPPVGAKAAADAGSGPAQFGIETLNPPGSADRPGVQRAERPRGEAFGRALYGDPQRRISARNKEISVNQPATGCLADAQKRLLGEGGPRRDLTLRLRLDQGERDALRTLGKDSAFRGATARWRSCMRHAGFSTAKDPQRLAATLRPDTPLTEQPAARADVTCKHATGYLKRAYDRLALLQQRWLDANPQPAAAWRSLRQRESEAAAKVLKDG
ncbi:hypothetical protein [Streptomyces sp. NPDC059063]|uniref:hypothetical protein n=1 Tax=unclassified Streptomyces TaxID=2593676 RepID=UPI0036933CEE